MTAALIVALAALVALVVWWRRVARRRRAAVDALTGPRCEACGFGIPEQGRSRCAYCRRRGLHAIR